MKPVALLVALAVLSLPTLAAETTHLLPQTPDLPLSAPPAEYRTLSRPDLPWDTNALADSMDYSNPPDGALFVARHAGPDSSIILLGYNYNNGGWWARISRSTDGGRTFIPTSLDTGFFVDVCLEGNTRDTCYFLCMVQVQTSPRVLHLYIMHSWDGGATWGDTIRVDRGTSTFPDKPMFTSRDTLLCCTYTDFTGGTHYIRFCYSYDQGFTWNTGDINVSNTDGQGSCPAIGPNGELYAVWGQPASWVPTTIWFNRSFDDGATWDTPRQIAALSVSSHLPSWRANHTFPAMTVDTAGKIYVTVQNGMQGTGWDVMVMSSVDAGSTWSTPVMVNDDSVANSDQFCSWITLDHLQRPHVFWYDSRNYYPTNSGDVYYTWSDDGGVTWAPNERVNDATPCYTNSTRSQMGDYQQIDCDSNYVYCEWSDHRNGRTSWSYIASARRLLPDFVGVSEEPRPGRWEQSRFLLEPNAPNPVVQGTDISFRLESSERVSLQVYDRAGKLVRTLLAAELEPGRHTARWNGLDRDGRRVPAGVYCCRLETERGSATRQMVLAR